MTPRATPAARRSACDPGTDPAGTTVSDSSPRMVLARIRGRALGGDRPYVVGFLAALGLALVVVSGPIQTYTEQREIAERREVVLAVLEEENARLAARVRDLNDPDTIEAEAREEQGMYRPGEVPYVIVPPPVDQPRLGLDLSEQPDEQSWWQRVREAVGELFG